MDYFLFDFSGVQFHYTMSHLIKFSEFNVLYRKAQILIVKRILPTLLDYFLLKTVTNKTIVKAFSTKN